MWGNSDAGKYDHVPYVTFAGISYIWVKESSSPDEFHSFTCFCWLAWLYLFRTVFFRIFDIEHLLARSTMRLYALSFPLRFHCIGSWEIKVKSQNYFYCFEAFWHDHLKQVLWLSYIRCVASKRNQWKDTKNWGIFRDYVHNAQRSEINKQIYFPNKNLLSNSSKIPNFHVKTWNLNDNNEKM